jgi:hypothetical protein
VLKTDGLTGSHRLEVRRRNPGTLRAGLTETIAYRGTQACPAGFAAAWETCPTSRHRRGSGLARRRMLTGCRLDVGCGTERAQVPPARRGVLVSGRFRARPSGRANLPPPPSARDSRARSVAAAGAGGCAASGDSIFSQWASGTMSEPRGWPAKGRATRYRGAVQSRAGSRGVIQDRRSVTRRGGAWWDRSPGLGWRWE